MGWRLIIPVARFVKKRVGRLAMLCGILDSFGKGKVRWVNGKIDRPANDFYLMGFNVDFDNRRGFRRRAGLAIHKGI